MSSTLTIDRQTIGEDDEEDDSDEIPLEMARHPGGKPDLDQGKKRLSGDGSNGHPKQIQNEFASVDDGKISRSCTVWWKCFVVFFAHRGQINGVLTKKF